MAVRKAVTTDDVAYVDEAVTTDDVAYVEVANPFTGAVTTVPASLVETLLDAGYSRDK